MGAVRGTKTILNPRRFVKRRVKALPVLSEVNAKPNKPINVPFQPILELAGRRTQPNGLMTAMKRNVKSSHTGVVAETTINSIARKTARRPVKIPRLVQNPPRWNQQLSNLRNLKEPTNPNRVVMTAMTPPPALHLSP
jgi:hypothetical protein